MKNLIIAILLFAGLGSVQAQTRTMTVREIAGSPTAYHMFDGSLGYTFTYRGAYRRAAQTDTTIDLTYIAGQEEDATLIIGGVPYVVDQLYADPIYSLMTDAFENAGIVRDINNNPLDNVVWNVAPYWLPFIRAGWTYHETLGGMGGVSPHANLADANAGAYVLILNRSVTDPEYLGEGGGRGIGEFYGPTAAADAIAWVCERTPSCTN